MLIKGITVYRISDEKVDITFYSSFELKFHLFPEQKKNWKKMDFRLYYNINVYSRQFM